MQDAVRFEDSKRLDKRHAGVKPPPFSGVPHPVDIEAVSSHAVDTGEGRIELFAAIMLHARPIALDEAISPGRLGAVDIDHVVPFGRPDLRQEARFHYVANEGLAGGDDHLLFRPVRYRWPGRGHPQSHCFFRAIPPIRSPMPVFDQRTVRSRALATI
jgi:hypothetical protein